MPLQILYFLMSHSNHMSKICFPKTGQKKSILSFPRFFLVYIFFFYYYYFKQTTMDFVWTLVERISYYQVYQVDTISIVFLSLYFTFFFFLPHPYILSAPITQMVRAWEKSFFWFFLILVFPTGLRHFFCLHVSGDEGECISIIFFPIFSTTRYDINNKNT